MSHEIVQAILERFVVDEPFRAQLAADPDVALADYDLAEDEKAALHRLVVENDPGSSALLDERRSKRPLWMAGL